ncbi:MAG: DNA polymerase III subunit delta [Gammaproteobacteria bacterium CG11_big_fil_rev_8_21_14_0_20_46_22]|nr:MAG: DNA polymerase III subunit delta [Gammaproteobacteria bacterium CG12_big_fil_rev_8_21_14_0_65_46_12]PIR10835.1 MAG: DNA polymerase III subunit delta [Gammaproteobacteria bacterium CG11_big_fil_rev_8_21_14_0_20_46_22]
MKVYPEKLSAALKAHAPNVLTISSDEPCLHEEALDTALHFARAQGFDEHDKLSVDNKSDIAEANALLNNLSLFGTQKIVELRFNDKPNKSWQGFLSDYTKQAEASIFLIVRLPKLEKAQQNAKWYQALDNAGLSLTLWPPKPEEFKAWLRTRARALKLDLSDDMIGMIAEHTEGNLLAAKQALQKLSFVTPLTPEAVKEQLSHDARFDVFALVDAIYAGDITRTGSILNTLKLEGQDPILILWAINREVHLLLGIVQAKHAGQSIDSYFRSQKIWPQKQALMRRFFQQAKKGVLYDAISDAQQIDACIKGAARGDVWQGLLILCLKLQGVQV